MSRAPHDVFVDLHSFGSDSRDWASCEIDAFWIHTLLGSTTPVDVELSLG